MKKGRSISVSHAVAFAWPTYKANWRLFLTLLLSVLLAWVTLEIIVIKGQHFGLLLWTIAHVAFLIFFGSAQLGFVRTCLALRDHHQPTFAESFVPALTGALFLVAMVLYALMVIGGLALLVAPGVYLGARYLFFGYSFAEGERSIANALRSAARLSRDAIASLSAILAGLVFLNVLGAAVLGVGMLVTIPISGLVLADVYRQLSPSVRISERVDYETVSG